MCIRDSVRDETAGILKTLSPKEEKVIRLRFGIGCEREHTLEEIGQEFDVTRERIRQIEAKALRQLRAPERARRPVSYTHLDVYKRQLHGDQEGWAP